MSRLTHAEILELKRWNTPTIYNGWEQITSCDPASGGFNLEECHDFMPQMGPMAGYAVTVRIEPSVKAHKEVESAWANYRAYMAALPGPKIVVVEDLDKPRVIGSFWGEVNSNTHRALGCVGTITDGANRDVDEMSDAGFKALARRLCVGHAHVVPVEWDIPVRVFGTEVEPGQLIHADQHGFLAIPEKEQEDLLEAARFMDSNECQTVIAAAREVQGMGTGEILKQVNEAGEEFSRRVRKKYGGGGEW
ncbi:MAG: RraA family protein [Verrucomicrobiota bacterium]|nr:RraA family protein [Verrucomicrobiota bacterium]